MCVGGHNSRIALNHLVDIMYIIGSRFESVRGRISQLDSRLQIPPADYLRQEISRSDPDFLEITPLVVSVPARVTALEN